MPSASIRYLGFIIRFIVLGLAIAFVIRWIAPSLTGASPDSPSANPPAATANNSASMVSAEGPFSYNNAVTRASPAVVSIYANKITTVRQYRIVPDPITRRLFGAIAAGPAYRKQEHSLGSGVVFSADGSEGLTMEVVDLTGKEVFRSSLGTRAPGIQKEVIDISALAAGLYNVRITDSLGGQGIKRLVVQ